MLNWSPGHSVCVCVCLVCCVLCTGHCIDRDMMVRKRVICHILVQLFLLWLAKLNCEFESSWIKSPKFS